MSVRIVNMTGHQIKLYGEDGYVVLDSDIKDNGFRIPRVNIDVQQVGSVNISGVEIPLFTTHAHGIRNMPGPQENTLYIVPKLLADYLKDQRDDLVVVHQKLVANGSNKDAFGARALTRII